MATAAVTISNCAFTDKDGATVTGEFGSRELVGLTFSRTTGNFSATNVYRAQICDGGNDAVLASTAATWSNDSTACVYDAGNLTAALDLGATPMLQFMDTPANPLTRTARMFLFDSTADVLWLAKEVSITDNGITDASATVTALDDY